MLVLQRIVLPIVNAAIITIALIYCMFLLIETEPLELSSNKSYKLDWVNIPEEPVVKPIETIIKKPKLIEDRPVIERVSAPIKFDFKDSVYIPVEEVVIDNGPVEFYKSDQLTLAFAYPAVYPSNKLNRGIEGYVVVGFSVNQVGEVFDAYIIESEPQGAFDKSALKAIAKFKYQPRYENQRAVSTEGQSYVFRYEINE